MNCIRNMLLSLFFPVIILVFAGAEPVKAQFNGKIMTVKGPVEPAEMGLTLPHEHVLVDFIGADQVSRERYDRDSVAALVVPYLRDLKQAGGETLIECTPSYLGRDPVLLRRLSDQSGIKMLTNTGYYGNEKGNFLPSHVYEETARQLADRWTDEWKNGIDGTGIRPGFIKLRVDKSPISETGQKLLEAAAETHKKSGLTIGVHTPDGATALEQLEILSESGIDPAAFIWIHAQNESDSEIHQQVARMGAWVEFDGIGPSSADYHFQLINSMKEADLLHRVLISHDAGWYRVGEPGGDPNSFDPYTYIINHFIPRLKREGFTPREIDMLTRENPQQAFTISVRTSDS
ncbi:phosphotriesterase [Halalkalibaculum sp. DA384]|uniref:phosphotriesterase family protein n=1 Tax=Halalkalibaculum sp. DA384 TaxID=3373606 RepID=UPI0037544E0A